MHGTELFDAVLPKFAGRAAGGCPEKSVVILRAVKGRVEIDRGVGEVAVEDAEVVAGIKYARGR